MTRLTKLAAVVLSALVLASCGDSGPGSSVKSIEAGAPTGRTSLANLEANQIEVAKSELPDGWKRDGAGKWLDEENANQVVVYVQENPATLDAIVTDTKQGVVKGGGKILKGPESVTFLGDDSAKSLTYTRDLQGTDVEATEYYLVKDGVVVIATGVVFPTGVTEKDEIRDVLDALAVE